MSSGKLYDPSNIKATFELDIEARFNADSIKFKLESPGIPVVTPVKIIEVIS